MSLVSLFFFFKQKTAYEMRISDWSSDVCSSDLAGAPGKYQPPHNHTTWAVIASVYGDEHNIFFERIDDGSTPDVGRIRKLREITVSPGMAVTLTDRKGVV